MVLAAGLGTRLRPLTNDRPKALATLAGRTLLEITLARLRSFGIRDGIVNAHHFADQVIEYLAANQNFGMHIEVSSEADLLDTGGGLKKAAWFFLDGGSHEPFVVHNVDVLSTIDLNAMLRQHQERDALATLAMQDRATSRPLLFDGGGQLRGRAQKGVTNPVLASLAFAGIHILSPRIFSLMREVGAFSIIDSYLRLAAVGETIAAFHAEDFYWRDLGRPESLAQAEADIASGYVPLSQ